MKQPSGLKLDHEGAASCTQVHHIRAGHPQATDRKFKPIKDTDNNDSTTKTKT